MFVLGLGLEGGLMYNWEVGDGKVGGQVQMIG